jgi:CTP:molybdopterin cytidylyltransferase MocA
VSVAAIILAAGESRRMGRPKALLPFRDGTFLSVLARTLSDCCGPVYAVFGFDARLLMARAPASVVAVENPDYQQGMLTSLQAGLRKTIELGELPERVLFTLVDHPAVECGTVRDLLRSDAPLVMPRYAGKRGHPVIMRREIAREILTEPVTSRLNHVMDRHSSEIHYIDVDDLGVREDIDDPALYKELLERESQRV